MIQCILLPGEMCQRVVHFIIQPSEQETLTPCRSNGGTASATLAQHWSDTGSTSAARWELTCGYFWNITKQPPVRSYFRTRANNGFICARARVCQIGERGVYCFCKSTLFFLLHLFRYSAVQNQEAVSAYLTSKQILLFGFARKYWCMQLKQRKGYLSSARYCSYEATRNRYGVLRHFACMVLYW